MAINKVRVTRLFGAGATVGLIDPKVGMTTDRGVIAAINGDGSTVSVSGGGSALARDYYPHELAVHQSVATGSYSYPTGDGSLAFGHQGIWPNGVSTALGTGIFYKTATEDDGGVSNTTRPR